MNYRALIFTLALALVSCRHGRPEGWNCYMNLRYIDGVKQAWADEHHKATSDSPTWGDLRVYFAHEQLPRCPHGGTYTIGRVGELPTCSVAQDTAYFKKSVEMSAPK